MLYQKMEDNSALQRKLEQTQSQQMLFLTQMMNQQGNSPCIPAQASPRALQA